MVRRASVAPRLAKEHRCEKARKALVLSAPKTGDCFVALNSGAKRIVGQRRPESSPSRIVSIYTPTPQHREIVCDHQRIGRRDLGREYDEVAETVEVRLEQQAVRRCLGGLTELQRESVQLAYYGGYTYKEVGELLEVPLGTVKTRLRDGLIRLRDCLGVTA